MKNTLRQIVVALTILVTIAINILADALPINGLNTGKISDSFHVYFVPAGYVFAIWGIIYIGLIAYAVYQALPAQKWGHYPAQNKSRPAARLSQLRATSSTLMHDGWVPFPIASRPNAHRFQPSSAHG